MKTNIKNIILGFGLLSFSSIFAQETISLEDAVAKALENNYDIQIEKNNVEIAENNAGILNSEYLPRVTANASYNYSKNNISNKREGEPEITVDGATTKGYNTSIGLEYTLFDGFGRKYNYKKLKETKNLSELQARSLIEETILNLATEYYKVARLTKNLKSLEESLEISKERLKRTQYNFDYGQNTKLDVLNAEVDVNNDKINLLNTQTELQNAKRNLNNIMGVNTSIAYEVEPEVVHAIDLSKENIKSNAWKENVSVLQANKNIQLREYDTKISASGFYPTLNVSGRYQYNQSENFVISGINDQQTNGFNLGATLTWNIFDGGRTKVQKQNAKVNEDIVQIQKQQLEQNLDITIENSWNTYQNALFVLEAQRKNVVTNQHNFERSKEQYNLGQITNIDFRQAQINLLNAEVDLNKAIFDAKNAELALRQLEGKLLSVFSE
ncbi:TolC family protein [Aureivirga sp. CE67]|uniref:TolC family protein n=1 Tax=Aureivirga sp. CE67 TaxID=1788983 RepID=UPI0018CAE098|nr:TolC family protein [Aureivirga sp. CE67]